ETGAAGGGVGCAPEAVEGALALGGGHAWALVDDVELRGWSGPMVRRPGRGAVEGDGAAGGRGAQCVGQEVVEDLFQGSGDGLDVAGGCAGEPEGDVEVGGEGRPGLDPVVDHGVGVNGGGGGVVFLQAGQGEQPVDHAHEAVGFGDGLVEMVAG